PRSMPNVAWAKIPASGMTLPLVETPPSEPRLVPKSRSKPPAATSGSEREVRPEVEVEAAGCEERLGGGERELHGEGDRAGRARLRIVARHGQRAVAGDRAEGALQVRGRRVRMQLARQLHHVLAVRIREPERARVLRDDDRLDRLARIEEPERDADARDAEVDADLRLVDRARELHPEDAARRGDVHDRAEAEVVQLRL